MMKEEITMIYEFKCSSKRIMKKYEAFIKSNFYIDIVSKVLHDYDLNIFIRVSVFNESYSSIAKLYDVPKKNIIKNYVNSLEGLVLHLQQRNQKLKQKNNAITLEFSYEKALLSFPKHKFSKNNFELYSVPIEHIPFANNLKRKLIGGKVDSFGLLLELSLDELIETCHLSVKDVENLRNIVRAIGYSIKES